MTILILLLNIFFYSWRRRAGSYRVLEVDLTHRKHFNTCTVFWLRCACSSCSYNYTRDEASVESVVDAPSERTRLVWCLCLQKVSHRALRRFLCSCALTFYCDSNEILFPRMLTSEERKPRQESEGLVSQHEEQIQALWHFSECAH